MRLQGATPTAPASPPPRRTASPQAAAFRPEWRRRCRVRARTCLSVLPVRQRHRFAETTAFYANRNGESEPEMARENPLPPTPRIDLHRGIRWSLGIGNCRTTGSQRNGQSLTGTSDPKLPPPLRTSALKLGSPIRCGQPTSTNSDRSTALGWFFSLQSPACLRGLLRKPADFTSTPNWSFRISFRSLPPLLLSPSPASKS
jgi:hypothetical protein